MADPVGVTGCELWVDGSDPATVHHTANALDTWDDKSGNARHLVQATGTAKPTVNTRTQNGLNVVDFDGSTDIMGTASFVVNQPATYYVVCKSDDGADSTTQVVVDRLSGTSLRGLQKRSSNVWSMSAGANLDGGTADTNAAYFTSVFNTTSSVLRRNGTQLNAGDAGSNNITTGVRVGQDSSASVFWDGWIAEVLLYSGAHTSTEWDQVEAYLNTKWFVAETPYTRPAVIVGASQAAQRASRW